LYHDQLAGQYQNLTNYSSKLNSQQTPNNASQANHNQTSATGLISLANAQNSPQIAQSPSTLTANNPSSVQTTNSQPQQQQQQIQQQLANSQYLLNPSVQSAVQALQYVSILLI
jgi:hypothetical protein